MTDESSSPKNRGSKERLIGIGMALGAGIGVALGAGVGVALGNIAIGAGIGVALGAAVGMTIAMMRR